MQMGAGGAAGLAYLADGLALAHAIAFVHQDGGGVEEGAVEAVAVIDDDQLSFQRKFVTGRQGHHAVSRGHEDSAGGDGDVRAAMIAAGLSLIDPLRSEKAGLPPGDRPDEILPPAVALYILAATSDDLRQLRAATLPEGRATDPSAVGRVDMLQLPVARRYGQSAFDRAAVRQLRREGNLSRRIAIQPQYEESVISQFDVLALELERHRIAGDTAGQEGALDGYAFEPEVDAFRFAGCRFRSGSGVRGACGRGRIGLWPDNRFLRIDGYGWPAFGDAGHERHASKQDRALCAHHLGAIAPVEISAVA